MRAKLVLTDRQEEVFVAIRAYIEEHGQGPTLEETCELIGVRSTHTVRRMLDILKRKGFLQPRGYDKPRNKRSVTRKGSRYHGHGLCELFRIARPYFDALLKLREGYLYRGCAELV